MSELAKTTIDIIDPQPVWVVLDANVTHKCPIDGTADSDHLEVTYDGRQGVIEVLSWETYLEMFDPMAITIEQLAEMVRTDLLACGIIARCHAWGEHGDGTMVEVRTYEPDRR